ncbi:AAA family ATPase [Dyadobacter luticola]|uniref:ATP-binding protein n=1 Tax=Dyadobacter luticola TaxID=1979387 RepID=A0A5R9L1M9_9BACT|nr:ATP-binding protein [Dyadobacter luticola]TLV02433.1 ATP-binding protein [Dyadobacter luticola]
MKEPGSGLVIVVSGLPGSGKSYFAERLAEALEAVYLSSDKIRNSLQARGKYALEDKMHIYHVMAAMTARQLDRGQPVVADATFYHHIMRDLFSEIASKHYANIAFIEIIATEALIRQRLASPREDSEADFGVYESMKGLFEPYTTEHLELHSGNDNLSEMLAVATAYLQQYD